LKSTDVPPITNPTPDFTSRQSGLPDIFFRNNSAAVGSRGGAYSSGAAVFWNRLSL
jgi:hypothetical protein